MTTQESKDNTKSEQTEPIMPIEFKRKGNVREKCKKPDTEVGKISNYTNHGDDLLLCPECLKKREEPYTEICPKCKRLAYKHGGLTYFDESDVDDSNGYESLTTSRILTILTMKKSRQHLLN